MLCVLQPRYVYRRTNLEENRFRVLCGKRFVLGQHHLARAAPRGGVVHHHELVLVFRGDLVQLVGRVHLSRSGVGKKRRAKVSLGAMDRGACVDGVATFVMVLTTASAGPETWQGVARHRGLVLEVCNTHRRKCQAPLTLRTPISSEIEMWIVWYRSRCKDRSSHQKYIPERT